MNKILPFLILLIFVSCNETTNSALSEKEQIGKLIFLDETLSEPAGQSCATCHTDSVGFVDVHSREVSEGAVTGLFGNRNAMTSAYTSFVPPRYWDEQEQCFIGGLFWDGRSDNLTSQAGDPFLNPLEMGNKDKAMVVNKIKKAKYYKRFVKLYGKSDDVEVIYLNICDAIAAYESSSEVNPFNSKYDLYLAGKVCLTDDELLGLELFKEKGKCADCHTIENDKTAGKPLFTDNTYDNLGIPKNPNNPFYCMLPEHNCLGSNHIDLGLGEIVKCENENGKFRVVTLRNIVKTAPYGHNGYFASLKEIVNFYNVRDIGNFPPAEYPHNVNKEELGNLGLTDKEEDLIILFLHTLTDHYKTK